jgi:hypothetical protein
VVMMVVAVVVMMVVAVVVMMVVAVVWCGHTHPVKVTNDELLDFSLCGSVHCLKLVQSGKLVSVESVRCHNLGSTLQQVLGFICCDLRHGSEHVTRVRRRPLDAVAVVDLTISCLLVRVKVRHVVVEVDACAGRT